MMATTFSFSIRRFTALAASITVGDPKDPATEMGPLTSPGHRDRVLSFLKVADDEGDTILSGGRAPADTLLADGCYLEPTVVRAAPDAPDRAREVFGPVVVSTLSATKTRRAHREWH
jgi:acyl-CoA reductase-like NAD-dependent aldehyde dehydrogenase